MLSIGFVMNTTCSDTDRQEEPDGKVEIPQPLNGVNAAQACLSQSFLDVQILPRDFY